MVECDFQSAFKSRYEKTGKKNLRCFPTCSDRGHIASGFCGKPIVCALRISKESLARAAVEEEAYELRAWGEFVVCGTAEEWNIGSTQNLSEFAKRERKRTQPMLPLVRGEIQQVYSYLCFMY